MEERKTYKIKLKCGNCYKEFESEIPLGIEAEEKGGYGIPTYVHYGENYTHIKCPNCECTNVRKIRS